MARSEVSGSWIEIRGTSSRPRSSKNPGPPLQSGALPSLRSVCSVGIVTACFSLIAARLDRSVPSVGSSQHSGIERSDSEFKTFRDCLDEAVAQLSGSTAARNSPRQAMGFLPISFGDLATVDQTEHIKERLREPDLMIRPRPADQLESNGSHDRVAFLDGDELIRPFPCLLDGEQVQGTLGRSTPMADQNICIQHEPLHFAGLTRYPARNSASRLRHAS